MGASSSQKYNISNENLFQILKNIPYDQYTCTECDLVPEIIKINYDKGRIKFKCPNHGEKKLGLKEYFIQEKKHSYFNYECILDKKKQFENQNETFIYCTECRQYLCQQCIENHEHKSSFLKVNELNYKCNKHFI